MKGTGGLEVWGGARARDLKERGEILLQKGVH